MLDKDHFGIKLKPGSRNVLNTVKFLSPIILSCVLNSSDLAKI